MDTTGERVHLSAQGRIKKKQRFLKKDLTGLKSSANIPPMNILITLSDEAGRLLEERAALEKRTKTAMARLILLEGLEKGDTEK
jgi:hypothetical protein